MVGSPRNMSHRSVMYKQQSNKGLQDESCSLDVRKWKGESMSQNGQLLNRRGKKENLRNVTKC